jgi:hypothetical protein
LLRLLCVLLRLRRLRRLLRLLRLLRHVRRLLLLAVPDWQRLLAVGIGRWLAAVTPLAAADAGDQHCRALAGEQSEYQERRHVRSVR